MSITTGVRARRGPAAGIWVLAAGCWSVLIALSLTGIGHPGHHDVAGDTAGLVGVAGFLAGWLTMVGAMMLPVGARPAHRLATPVRAPARGQVWSLVASFAGVWAAFGLVALAGDAGVHRLVDGWAWLGARPGLVLAGVLLLAGAFRLCALAAAAVRRGSGSPLSAAAASGSGWRGGLRLGAGSLVCDGPLMLVMFAAGAGDLGLMVTLTAVMVAERDERWGGRVATLTGCVLVAAGAIVAAASR